ncbi:serine/threonine protein kinase [Actinoallomurus sp. NBC_01490]
MARFAALGVDDPRAVAGYVLRARLGGGGMGQVYLSFSPGGRAVAVKVVRPELADDPEFRRRFRREVEVAQQVQGPYTAPVLDADPEAPRPWLATAYIAGPTLQEAVMRHGRLPQPAVARLLAGCAEALASVHAAGLVHRDFKPGNVLLADDGPRVIDFGIARAADASTLTHSGLMIGTPSFMAPEQVKGQEITPAADVFALALTAYYAVTGQSAFGDGIAANLAYRIVHENPELNGCPPDLRPLLARCLDKDPARRPGTTQIIEQARVLVPDEQPEAGTWLPPVIATTLTQYRPATPPQDVPPHPSTLQNADARTRPAIAPSVPAHGSGPSMPYASTGNRAMLRRDGAPRRPLLIAAAAGIAVFAVGLVALAVLPKGHSGAETKNHGSPVTHAGAAETPASGGSPSSASSSPTPYGGQFVQEYKDVTFSLPGGGSISGVYFTDNGPKVTTDNVEADGADLQYFTVSDPELRLRFDSVEMASSTGPADAGACYDAVNRSPIAGAVSYPSLKIGAVFCLTNTMSNQLTYIRLTGKRPGRLTWSATGWLSQSE